MKRFLLHSISALLAFLLGVALAPPRFSQDLIAHGITGDGGRFATFRYTSSYRVELWHTTGVYPTEEQSKEAFRKRLKESFKVIEQGAKLDESGRVVGERAVAIFFSEEHNNHYACILWTEGQSYREILSPSLVHVLEFENQEKDH